MDAWAAGKFLGLTDAEFWEMTPREFHAVFEKYLDSEERQDRRAGMLYVLYYNSHRPEHASPLTLEEFLPGRKSKNKRLVLSPDEYASAEQQVEWARQFTAAFRGTSG